MAREIENAFPSVVFGVAPGVLKKQYDDVLEDFIRSTTTGGERCSNGGRASHQQSSVGGIYHLGKGGISESDTDSDNGRAGAETVWRRRVRVVLRRRGGCV